MSAQPPSGPAPNTSSPIPAQEAKEANVPTATHALPVSSAESQTNSVPAGPSGPSRLLIPDTTVATPTRPPHMELTRPPRTPPGPDNLFKYPEESQANPQGLHYDAQSRVPHKGGLSAEQGSYLPQNGDSHPLPPPPQPARVSDRPPVGRPWTGGSKTSNRRSAMDWIVPVSEEDEIEVLVKPHHAYALTYEERLEPTIKAAKAELKKCEDKARTTGWALNVAIGLQVVLGSLTTGLSAVATSGRSAAVSTTILGGLSTVVASYLARTRGSNEPQLSITRSKDLQKFIRECSCFVMDHGFITGTEHDKELEGYRKKFEELLGNGDGQRKLSSPA